MNDDEKFKYILNFMKKRYFKEEKTYVMVGHDSKDKFALFVKANPMRYVVGEFSDDKKSFKIRTEIYSANDLIHIAGRGYLNFMYEQLYNITNDLSPISITDSDLDEIFKL